MNLDEVLHTFVIESRELLDQMEEALLRIEQMPDDADTINAIFRAAHTIKGSAGLFGLDHMVEFTHVAESVLDKVRSLELAINSELVVLFLAVCDHLGILINHVSNGQAPGEDIHLTSASLMEKLRVYLDHEASRQAVVAPAAPEGQVEREDSVGADTDNWHISLRFHGDVLRHGLDPLSFIRYLGTFGRIARMVTLTDSVPPLDSLDPETSYLGYEISYQSDASKAEIEGAFEFVRDDSIVRILPPHSKVTEYLQHIEGLPEEDMRLGEILVRCGTLTQTELDSVLKFQAAAPGDDLRPIGEVLVEQHLVRPRVVEAALDKQKQVKEHKGSDGGLIRVNAEKLDQHINLIGELIIASAAIGVNARRANQADLLEAASTLSRLVEEVRDSALQLRMVQIGATFTKFQRVVRDVSRELGKDIRLEISGAETELDKTVVEKIGDPLTHLVRNSMDHGIEPAELRLARGKPAHGTLKLNAFHDSGNIVIEVSDDGGGLNREKILAKAVDRGLVNPDQALSDQEIYALIFEPGFSTADKVNNLSGRGVGMDVVRRNITALRGTVDIDSQEGCGTTMRIRLPLTLAIIDGFLVGVQGSSFVVPLETVVECVELTAAETESARNTNYINLRGEVLPFIRLKELFDIPDTPPAASTPAGSTVFGNCSPSPLQTSGNSPTAAPHAAVGAEGRTLDPMLAALLQPTKRENVVVVRYAGHQAGLVVDSLMGEYQTVIRPLGQVFNGLPGIGGFTILGSGQVSLILDVAGLVRQVSGRNRAHSPETPRPALPH
ncbi:MAG TPA: chemotaxis protein CheA [Rhodocyclaceae bacterium]|nr:chemotaxis protein CheA [Rhodocyclaceae bacterium]